LCPLFFPEVLSIRKGVGLWSIGHNPTCIDVGIASPEFPNKYSVYDFIVVNIL